MTNIIDIKKGKKQAKRRFITHISLILLLSAAVITGSVLLLIYSNLDYIWNLILDIVICSLLLIFLIFYFLNIFPIIKHYLAFFSSINQTAIEHRRRMVFIKEIQDKNIDNVNHRVLQFAYHEGDKEYIEDLYVVDSDISFDANYIYRLDTFRNVIVAFEVL